MQSILFRNSSVHRRTAIVRKRTGGFQKEAVSKVFVAKLSFAPIIQPNGSGRPSPKSPSPFSRGGL